MNLKALTLAAAVTLTGFATAAPAQANALDRACHATTMRIADIGLNARSYRDANRMYEEINYHINLGCGEGNHTRDALEASLSQTRLIQKAMSYVCSKRLASC